MKHWTVRSLLETDVRDRALLWTGLILRDREFPADLKLKWSHRLSVVLVYLILINLVLVPRSGISLPLAGLCLVALVAVNRRLYLFFAARRTWRFMLAAILMHFMFYLYGDFAFAVGLVLWLMPQRQKAKA